MVVGAALGTMIGNPFLAFGAGVISHLALDMMPHREWSPVWGEVLGGVLLLIIIASLALPRDPSMFLGAVGAAIPDLEIILAITWLEKKPNQLRLFFHRFRQPVAYSLFAQSLQVWIFLAAVGFLSVHYLP